MTERSAFEDAIVQAIANSFFHSQPGYTDPNGSTTWNPAPALQVAYKVFEAKREEIMVAVIEKLDVDDLATKIAEPLVRALTERPNIYGRDSAADEAFRKDLRTAVIDKVAQAQADAILAAQEVAKPA